MSTITTRIDNSTYNVLLKEGYLRKLFDDTVRAAVVYHDKFCKMLTTKDAWVLDQQHAGLTAAVELVEGQNIPAQTPVLGGQKKYNQRRFGTGFRMTDKMIKFNNVKYWDKMSKELGKVMKESVDIEIHVPWNSPTSTTLACGTGFDTLAMANDTHTGLLAGSTADNYDNYINSALSYTSLESARYYFKTKKDAMGMLCGSIPDTLMVEPTLDPTVHELLKSDYKAHEMSNTDNYYKSMGLTVISNPRLTNTARWYMLAKNSDRYDFNVFEAFAPDFVTGDAPDTSRDRVATSQTYFTYGWGWPGMIVCGY